MCNRKKMGRKKKISPEKVMEELAAIGFARATDYLSVERNELTIRATEELSPRERAAIASVEKTSSGLKLKFYDKLKALELLSKLLGMTEGKTMVSGDKNDLLEKILAATEEDVDTHDLPELQQAAAAGHDLVEPGSVSAS